MGWTIEKTTNGRILRSKTGRQMDASGSYVRGYSKQKTPRQVWAVEQVGVGKFVHFRNFVQNKCLDNYGKNKINGLFRMWKCDDKNEHQWYLMQAPKKLQRFPEGWFNIIGKTGLCMAARNNNGNVIQANCGDTDDLLWTTEREGDGIRIVNKTKRQMDAMGARILGYTEQNTPRQKGAIESLGNGRYHFRNYVQNKCVDDYGKNDVNKPFRMLSCDVKDNNQSFSFAPPKKIDLPKGWINIVGHSGLCMSSRLVNGNLQQQKCGDRESLLWKIERAEKGDGYVLRNKSDRVMYNSGNSVLGYRRNNSWQIRWAIESVNHGKYITFRNIYRKTYCVDDYGKAQINHAYRTYICSNKNENQWFSLEAPKQLAKLREGWFNIVSKNGLCVSSRLNNSNLQQEKCGDLDTLLWTIEKTTNGRILRSKTGRQMDASGSYVLDTLNKKHQDKSGLLNKSELENSYIS